jgi:crossover junction endodeoxyribonuclease RusA
MTITLPWPPAELNPNRKTHWRRAAPIKAKYRDACYILTKQSGAKIDWDGDVHVFMDFYPPDRRARDDDNIIAAFKSGRDGVAEALGINDKRFRIHPYVREEVGGMVKLTFVKGPQ